MAKTFEDTAQSRHSGMVRLTFYPSGDPVAYRASTIAAVFVDQRDRATVRVAQIGDQCPDGIPVEQSFDEVLARIAEAAI